VEQRNTGLKKQGVRSLRLVCEMRKYPQCLSPKMRHTYTNDMQAHPWWWRQYAPLKRRSTIILHGSTSQKTILDMQAV